MLRRQLCVDATECAEPLARPQLRLGTAWNVCRFVVVLCRLLEKQAAAEKRTARFQARFEAGNALDVEKRKSFQTKRRLDVLDLCLPAIGRALGLDDDHPGRKSAEFG